MKKNCFYRKLIVLLLILGFLKTFSFPIPKKQSITFFSKFTPVSQTTAVKDYTSINKSREELDPTKSDIDNIINTENNSFIKDEKLFFIQNEGQLVDQNGKYNPLVQYMFLSSKMNVQLRSKGFSYELFALNKHQNIQIQHNCKKEEALKVDVVRVDLDFIGINTNISLIPIRGRNGIEKIIYKEIYDGIDVEFLIVDGTVKYNFVVHPNGNPDNIRINVSGAEIILNNIISYNTPLGTIEETIPATYLLESEDSIPVYPVLEENVLSYKVQNYDSSQTLIIDPLPNLVWGTYYGGNITDFLQQVATDKFNNVYTFGHTISTNNIATAGAHQTTINVNFDCFLVKFNSNGVRQWATYFGGEMMDRGYGLVIDDSLNVYIGGNSNSSSGIATAGAHQTFNANNDDAFIAKFDSNGVLKWGTFYGGNGHDFIADMVLDNNGNIIVTGHTRSSNGISTLGTHQIALQGVENAFIAKFTPGGVLLWGTYYGNGAFDEGWGVRTDVMNNIYIAGHTESSSNISTPGSYQPIYGGMKDAFISKFTPNGIQIWGSYFGGPSIDKGLGLDLLDSIIYLTGTTESSTNISTSGAWQTSQASVDDSFLARFDTSGLVNWATYVGANDVDYSYSVATDSSGSAIITGSTQSDTGMAVSGALHDSIVGSYDAFIMEFNNQGIQQWGTYYGGTDYEEGVSVKIDKDQNILVVGYTLSLNGISTPGAHQIVNGGGLYDGFVSKFCRPPIPTLISSKNSTCAGLCDGIATVAVSGGVPPYSYLWSSGGTNPTDTGLCNGPNIVTVTDARGCYHSLEVTVTEPPPLILSFTSEPSSCADMCDGNMAVTPSGGSPPYAYNWGGSQDSSVTSVCGGNYSVTVSDTNGCNSIGYITINNPDSLLGNITIINASVDSCVAIATAYPVGGTPPYSYQWDDPNAQITQSAINLCLGTYQVTITDSNGCILILQVVIDTTVSINEILSTEIEMYPNPTNGKVFISVDNLTANTNLNLFNLVGELCFNNAIKKSIELDLHFLPSGVYFIRIGNITRKLVLAK